MREMLKGGSGQAQVMGIHFEEAPTSIWTRASKVVVSLLLSFLFMGIELGRTV
jgi:hypothetical protein